MNDYLREIALCDERLKELPRDSLIARALRERRHQFEQKLNKVALNNAEKDEFQLQRYFPKKLW